jgi:hypothetical protein
MNIIFRDDGVTIYNIGAADVVQGHEIQGVMHLVATKAAQDGFVGAIDFMVVYVRDDATGEVNVTIAAARTDGPRNDGTWLGATRVYIR